MKSRDNKPKVALVRGPALNKWDMETYEPLAKQFDVTAIGSSERVKINDRAGIKFPIIEVMCPGLHIGWVPKMIPMMYYLTGDTQWLLGLDKAVRGFDIVHVVDLGYAYTYQAIQAKEKGLVKTVVVTCNESIPYLNDEYGRKRSNKKEVLMKADEFIAVSKLARQVLLLEGASDDKVTVIPEAVDTKLFRPGRDSRGWRGKLGFTETDFVVLAVGRMVWEKGWYDVVPAAAYTKIRNKSVRYLCLGSGPELGSIKTLANREGLRDIVKFVDWIPYKFFSDICRMSDLFLYPTLPSRHWNAQFGRALVQEMATGVPIVGTISGGVRDDTVGEDGGLFVQPQDFSGLGEAILKLYKDKTLYKKISLRNRKVAVERYDVQVVARQIKRVWEKALR